MSKVSQNWTFQKLLILAFLQMIIYKQHNHLLNGTKSYKWAEGYKARLRKLALHSKIPSYM